MGEDEENGTVEVKWYWQKWEEWTDSIEEQRASDQSRIRIKGFWKQVLTEGVIYFIASTIFLSTVHISVRAILSVEIPAFPEGFLLSIAGCMTFCYYVWWDEMGVRSNSE